MSTSAARDDTTYLCVRKWRMRENAELADVSFIPLISKNYPLSGMRETTLKLSSPCSSRITSRTVAVFPVPGIPEMYSGEPFPPCLML